MKNLLAVIAIVLLCLTAASCSSGGDSESDGDNTADGDGADGEIENGGDAEGGGDGDLEGWIDGDAADGDIENPGDGDSEFSEDAEADDGEPVACTSARDCPQNRACHEGFCGLCSDASECRKLEACRPDGSCGACEDVAQCRDAKACLHGFCMPDDMLEASLSLNTDDFNEMHEFAYEDKFYACVLTVNGTAYGLGEQVRLLGDYSLKFPKRSFRITFPDGVDNPGYSRKINYKADWGDFTHMRSFISYHLFRTLTRLPVPRTRYLKLNVNDTYYGLMLEVERIGGNFLEVNGRDRERSLYEAAVPYTYGALVKMLYSEPYTDYYEKHTGADESDYSDLADFLENTLWPDYEDSGTGRPTVTTRTRQAVDIEDYIDYLAVMALVQNADSVTNNFYFSYQNVSGADRWEFYPWDMDLTWGCLWNPDLSKLCVDPQADHWWLNGIAKNGFQIGSERHWCNLLTHLVLNDPEYLEKYKARICEYLDSDLWRRLPDLAAALEEYLYAAVLADERDRTPDMNAYEAKVTELVNVMAAREEYLRAEVGCE